MCLTECVGSERNWECKRVGSVAKSMKYIAEYLILNVALDQLLHRSSDLQ